MTTPLHYTYRGVNQGHGPSRLPAGVPCPIGVDPLVGLISGCGVKPVNTVFRMGSMTVREDGLHRFSWNRLDGVRSRDRKCKSRLRGTSDICCDLVRADVPTNDGRRENGSRKNQSSEKREKSSSVLYIGIIFVKFISTKRDFTWS